MGRLKLGVALGSHESADTGEAPAWDTIKAIASSAEVSGFDTLWIADELVWERNDGKHNQGWWEAVALLGGIAATTSTIAVGSWVLSALHRNPGLTVKAAETIDAISNGRFIFGLGAGHAGRQGEAFGYPPRFTIGRYAEALEIIVPLLREGVANFDGTYHSAKNQENRPRGPKGRHMPLMLAGHGPRNIGLAVQYGDIWSAYATDGTGASAFKEMSELVDRACADQGRDPATLERSVGIAVQRTDIATPEHEPLIPPITGDVDQLVAELAAFAGLGFTSVEFAINSESTADIERLAPIVEAAKDL